MLHTGWLTLTRDRRPPGNAQSRASSPASGQQDTVNSTRSRAFSPTSCQQDVLEDFSDESDQEQYEPGVNVNELETSVVASDYKEHGQLNKPSPAALKNTAQSSPATSKNKAEGKVQIAEAASHGGGSDEESESSTGSPSTAIDCGLSVWLVTCQLKRTTLHPDSQTIPYGMNAKRTR